MGSGRISRFIKHIGCLVPFVLVAYVAFGQSTIPPKTSNQKSEPRKKVMPAPDSGLQNNDQGPELLDPSGKPLEDKKPLFPFRKKKAPAAPKAPQPIKVSENDCPTRIVT